MPAQKVHDHTLFECEKRAPVTIGSISGDKAYLTIRRGAKILTSALDALCSRKGVWL